MTARQQTIYLWLDPRNLIRSKLLLFPGRFCQARILDRVWGSSQGTGLSSLHRVSGGHQQSWLRMSSLSGVSSEAACPSFKRKGSSRAEFMVRKQKTNHLNHGNRLAAGVLNFGAGDHRFLLLTRQRRGFGVTSHILCKPKTLAIDEFGLLTNYLNFFHPNAERAYGVAMHWRQQACLGAPCISKAAEKISRCIRDFLLQWRFWCLQGSISTAFSLWHYSGVCNRGQRLGYQKSFSLQEYTDTVEIRTVR